MKKGFCNRIISMIVTICMILTLCPVNVLAGYEGDPNTITAGKLVAGAYGDLSQEEKDLIGSGLLADVAYEYYMPGKEDGLIQVDTENKTITADSWTDEENDRVWTPVDAAIMVNGSTYETVALDGEGVGSYTYDGNAFSVDVTYEMYISVDAAVQAQMLNTSGWLKDGIATLETIAAQSGNMSILETAKDQLLELSEMSVENPLGDPVLFPDEGKAAITAMTDQMTANGGKLTLHTMVDDYRSGSKTEYLLNSDSEMQPEVTELLGHVSELVVAVDDVYRIATIFDEFAPGRYFESEQLALLGLLSEKLHEMETGLQSVEENGDWTAAEKGADLVKADISDDEYLELDGLVDALGKVKTEDEFDITERFLVGKTTVQHTMNMNNIEIQVVLEVVKGTVDSDELVFVGKPETAVLTLLQGATKEEMEAALAGSVADLMEAAVAAWSEADEAWGEAYEAGHYDFSATELPEALTKDITYIITYSPKNYTITYAYAEGTETEEVPYGYRTKLPLYTGGDKVYDYTVDGEYYPQGSVVTVLGDMTVTRREGKPYTSNDLYTIISDMEGITEKEKAILVAGALEGNTEIINVRYPDTDGGNLVSVDSNLVLSGKTYPSDYKGLDWVPYSYVVTAGDGTDADPAGFEQNGDTYTAQIVDDNFREIKVYYRLQLKNFGEDAAQNALDLVAQLVDEIEGQKTALASLSSDTVKDNLGLLGIGTLTALESILGVYELNADPVKDAQLKECFGNAVAAIKADCLEGDVLGISILISAYIDSTAPMLYYYRNSDSFVDEVTLLCRHLDKMLTEDANLTADEKLDALAVLFSKMGYEDKVQKLPDLQEKLNGILDNLIRANDAIDTTSPALNKLVTALEKAGDVGTQYDDFVYLQSQSFNVAGSGQIILKVNVIYGNVEKDVTETVAQDAAIPQSAIDSLKSKVAARLVEMGIDDDFWYDSEEYRGGAALDDLVGRSFATNQVFNFTWVMLEHTYCEINGHTEEVIPGKQATCTSTGLTNGLKCSVCQEILTEQEEIPLLPHTEETIPAVKPTCNSTGLTEGLKCSVCHKVLQAQQEVDKLVHDYSGDWVKDATGHWKVCQHGCGAIDFAGHTYNTTSCAEAANCTVCDHPKAAGDHTFGLPVPVSDTEHERTCSSCGAKDKALHEGNWQLTEKKNATCEDPGYEKYVCICNAEKTVDLEASGHNWGPWTNLGDNHTRVCSNGTTDKCVQTGPHDWDDGVLNNDGDEEYTCTAGCGATMLVVKDKADRLAAGATVKAQLTLEQDGSVILPKPEGDDFDGPGYRYDYVINGTTYKVTNASEDDPIYPGSVANATVKLVNMDNEKVEMLAKEMGDAELEKNTALKPTQDGYYTGIKVETDANGIMDVVMALVQQTTLGANKYGYVALGNEPLLANGKVSLLGVLRMMMKDVDPDPAVEEYAYTSQDIIDLGSGTDKALISNKLVLSMTAPNTYAMRSSVAANDGHELDFQLMLTDTPAEVGKVASALTAVEDYVTFDIKPAYDENDVLVSDSLEIDVKVNLPSKVYEIYVMALRLTGKVDVNDANAVKKAVAYEFLKDYVNVLMDADVTTTTLMNTADKLGRTVDLSEYEGLFNAVRGKLGYNNGISYSPDGMSASVVLTNRNMEKVVDRMAGTVADAGMLDILKAMLVECQDSATTEIDTVKVKLNAIVTNFADENGDGFIDSNYEAIIIDVGAAKNPGLVAKTEIFDITENLAASVAGLKGAAAIMLQKDVTANLHFKKATILDLNGHTIDGTITADAKLIIIDSTLATATVGGVTKAITGNDITIMAGTYGTDVSDYLKNGYVQESGVVKNKYYEIKKVGNDITFEVNADILATPELPSVWLAADMAADLAMNYFTTAGLSFADAEDATAQNPYAVFAVNFENLVALITETTGEEKANAIMDILKLSGANGIEGFINDLMAKAMDFGTLAGAISGNTNVIKYNMVTTPWNVKLDAVEGEDYLTVGIVPGEKVFGSIAVTVVGTQENRDKIAAVLTEVGKIMDPTKNSITVALQDPAFANRTLTITGSGNVAIDIDMSTNPNYAAIVAVALASSGVNKDVFVAALDAYFADSSNTRALYEALSKVTVAQYISALKNPALNNGFSAMIAGLGVASDTSDAAAKLGDTYRLALVAVGRVLARLEIDGNSRVVFGPTGKVSYTNSDVTRNIARTAAGVTVSGTVTAESIDVTVALFPDTTCEHNYVPVVTPPTCEEDGYTTHTCSKCGHSYVTDPTVSTGHKWGDWEKLNDEQHYRECDNDPAHKEFGDHDYDAVVTQPDCDEGGYTTHTCSVCRDTYQDTFTPATGDHKDENGDDKCDDCDQTICGHVWGEWKKLNDEQHYRECDNDPNHKEYGDHDYDSVVTQPDCDEGGYTTHTCPVCNDTYVDTHTPATGDHKDENGDNICDDCNQTICDHVWGEWTKLNSQKHQRVCENDPAHVETENHVDANRDKKCDVCGASMSSGGPSGPGGSVGSSDDIEVLDSDKKVLGTDSFAEAVEAAKEGNVIKIRKETKMESHAYVNTVITITGADKLNDTGYVLYLNNTGAKITADAKLNIGSSVDGYKVVCTEGETFVYTLEMINEPETAAPVAGSNVETVNGKRYLILDLPTDGVTLNELRENTAFTDLVGSIKFEIEGNDGTGLVKTTDRMTVSSYNEDNNCVATITYVVIVMGDTNCNGRVNTSDATVMKNINFGETYILEVLIAADVNFSGTLEQPKVNSSDATYIMSKWFNWSTGEYKTNLE